MPRIQFNIRVNAGDLARWRDQATAEERSLTELVERAVDQYIQRDLALREQIRANLERRDKRRRPKSTL